MTTVPDDDIDMRAAEFVLGMLEADERRTIESARWTDPSFASAIGYWETRLAPLARHVRPIDPPGELWGRIEARLPVPRPAVLASPSAPVTVGDDVRRALGRSRARWRIAACGGFALAASLALALFLQRPADFAAKTYIAAITALPGDTSPVWLVESRSDGAIVLTALHPAERPVGKDFELWALAEGAKSPVSLGVLPLASRYVVPPEKIQSREHLRLLVSLEPRGGSPTGLPTGAVLYGGELTLVD